MISALNNLTESRRKLIIHRITRAVVEKLQREDIIAIYSFCYQEATNHRTYNMRLTPAELALSWKKGNDMLHSMLTTIQHKRRFDWLEEVEKILKEECIEVPTPDEISGVVLMLIGEVFKCTDV